MQSSSDHSDFLRGFTRPHILTGLSLEENNKVIENSLRKATFIDMSFVLIHPNKDSRLSLHFNGFYLFDGYPQMLRIYTDRMLSSRHTQRPLHLQLIFSSFMTGAISTHVWYTMAFSPYTAFCGLTIQSTWSYMIIE